MHIKEKKKSNNEWSECHEEKEYVNIIKYNEVRKVLQKNGWPIMDMTMRGWSLK